MEQKKKLLQGIYTVYSGWISRFPLACKKGCSDCCTQSVTMSSLEGRIILDFIEKDNKKKWLRERLAQALPETGRAGLTMNQFAEACLKQEETGDDSPGSWNFMPCVFLKQNICTIYGMRPFGCRSFGSLVKCTAGRAAEMAPIHLAVNTVFTQIVEHISSSEGYWGNMAVILKHLLGMEEKSGSAGLLPARPIPGFLLEPREREIVQALLVELVEQAEEKRAFGDLIDNFILME